MINEDALIRAKIPLAISMAARLVWQRRVSHIDYKDVAQEGLIGYLNAARRHIENPGAATLNTYAMRRMCGAMIDAVRPPRSDCKMPENVLCELDDAINIAGSDGNEIINALALQKIYYAFGLLPDQMRDVMQLIYIDDLTMLQAGEELGLSEGRISQIHKKAIAILRRRYGK